MKTTNSRHGSRPSGRDLQSGSSLISSLSTNQSFSCEFRFNFSGMQQNRLGFTRFLHTGGDDTCAHV